MNFKDLLKICLIFAGIIFFILIVNGFSSISTNEYGLNYSSISETIDEQTYSAGTYFLGIGHSFLKFPKSVITVDFSNEYHSDYPPINSRTSDGLEVQIEVSFQYTLDPTRLYTIYQTFNTDYKDIFDKIAIDILTTNTTEYSAYNFFWNRQEISLNMQTELNKYFEKWCFSHIAFFQLRNVNLPDKFEESIQETEVTKQSIQQAEALKDKEVIILKTKRITAEFQKNVTINLAEGDAQQILLEANATANALQTVQHQNAVAYGKLKNTLNLDGKGLLKYIKNKVIRQQQDSLTISLQGEDSCQANIQQHH